MTALSPAEWGHLMETGATTYTVGKVPGPYAVYLDRAEAGAAAELADGIFIQWDGRHGRQATTAGYDAEITAWQEPEARIMSELEPFAGGPVTNDLTAREAAQLLTKLQRGADAAWHSLDKAQWPGPEYWATPGYETRFGAASEATGTYLDVWFETGESGMRLPCETPAEFAKRVGVLPERQAEPEAGQ